MVVSVSKVSARFNSSDLSGRGELQNSSVVKSFIEVLNSIIL